MLAAIAMSIPNIFKRQKDHKPKGSFYKRVQRFIVTKFLLKLLTGLKEFLAFQRQTFRHYQ